MTLSVNCIYVILRPVVQPYSFEFLSMIIPDLPLLCLTTLIAGGPSYLSLPGQVHHLHASLPCALSFPSSTICLCYSFLLIFYTSPRWLAFPNRWCKAVSRSDIFLYCLWWSVYVGLWLQVVNVSYHGVLLRWWSFTSFLWWSSLGSLWLITSASYFLFVVFYFLIANF